MGAGLLLAASLLAAATAPLVEKGVAVRMRDGVVLRADVWRPAADGRFPVLVYRTPYDRSRAQGDESTVARAVARDYAVVAQDVRGRYGSEGYRGGSARRELLRPGQVYALRFENLMTGNTFRKGHRLRLIVSGAFFPHFSRNLQTGELETDSAVSRPARIDVHHSARYPSRLVLPVVGR